MIHLYACSSNNNMFYIIICIQAHTTSSKRKKILFRNSVFNTLIPVSVSSAFIVRQILRTTHVCRNNFSDPLVPATSRPCELTRSAHERSHARRHDAAARIVFVRIHSFCRDLYWCHCGTFSTRKTRVRWPFLNSRRYLFIA